MPHLINYFLFTIILLGPLPALTAGLAEGKQAVERSSTAEAFEKLKTLATAGDVESQRILGEQYFYGNGTPVNLSASYHWTTKAAQSGDRIAQYSAAYMLKNGLGVAANERLSIDYFMRSANQGYAPAMLELGNYYAASGSPGHSAMRWYELAMNAGNIEAREKYTDLLAANSAKSRADYLEKLPSICAARCSVPREYDVCLSERLMPKDCTSAENVDIANRSPDVSYEPSRTTMGYRFGSGVPAFNLLENFPVLPTNPNLKRDEGKSTFAHAKNAADRSRASPSEAILSKSSNKPVLSGYPLRDAPSADKGQVANEMGLLAQRESNNSEGVPSPNLLGQARINNSASQASMALERNQKKTNEVSSDKLHGEYGQDADGCIESVKWCSTAPTIEEKNENVRLIFRNTCPFRVYGTFANLRFDGSADVGATGVPPGKTHVWPTPKAKPVSFVGVFGSVRSSFDWVCSGKKLKGFEWGDARLVR